MARIEIAGRQIGPDCPCFIIAEAGVNHNGDVATAKQLIDVAVEAGADAVKFQTFKAERVISPDAPKAEYQRESTDPAEAQLDMIRRLELSEDSFYLLETYCRERGITFLSTPFDHPSVDFLDRLGVPAFKVPSGETVNLPLLRHIARKQKPVILSTGMSYLGEVERAIRTIQQEGNHQLVVLHCVSNYPTDPRDVNLKAMQTISQAFQVPVGFSDHTLGVEISLAAVAMGACVIEKHFTLDRNLPGPDHRASLEPDELSALVRGIRKVQAALGSGVKAPAASEENTRHVARRSIYLLRHVPAGSVIEDEDLIALRPAGGIAPDQFDQVVGRVAKADIPEGALLSWEMLG